MWWRCRKCDVVCAGNEVPDKCPVCGSGVFSFLYPARGVPRKTVSKRKVRRK